MAQLNIKGKLISIGEKVQVSEKFAKREFVLNTEGEYPDLFAMQFTQDKIGILDNYKIDDLVEVSVNVKGRQWANPNTGEIKYFVSLDAWAIKLVVTKAQAERLQSQESKPIGNIEANFLEDAINDMQEDDDDLPF